MERYELHKSQISDDFVYWFRNGEDIFQAVFRNKSLKMSVLYWRVPYIWVGWWVDKSKIMQSQLQTEVGDEVCAELGNTKIDTGSSPQAKSPQK